MGEAFRRLEGDDLVFGPTFDGGYYLIGMRGRGPSDALEGVPISVGTELDGITARAWLLGLSVGLLEPTFDVDVAEDLRRLRPLALERDDLRATRGALESLGLVGQRITVSSRSHHAPSLPWEPMGDSQRKPDCC